MRINLQISSQRLTLNINCQIFACKHSLNLLCSRKLDIHNRHDQLVNTHLQRSSSRAICKWDNAKTILSVTHAGTQTVCDSLGDSMLPTSSAHTSMHFSNGPGAEDCRGDSPALLKQWVGPGCVRGTGPSNYYTLWHLGVLIMSA